MFTALVTAMAVGQVQRVVVYADRAEVTRVQHQACKDQIVFVALPEDVDERTLRAEATGAEALGVTVRATPLGASSDARVQALEAELREVRAKRRVLQDRRAEHQRREALVAGYSYYLLQVIKEEVRLAHVSPDNWGRALDRLSDDRRAIAKDDGSAAEERALQRKEELLQARLSRWQPEADAETRTATVSLRCSSAQAVTVSLTYVVGGATWRPEYDLRFTPAAGRMGKGKAEITIGAIVQQATGEDWDNATLVLSTSKPRLGSEAPALAPQYVQGSEQKEREKVVVEALEKRTSLAEGERKDRGGQPSAELEDRGVAFALTVKRPVTVRADGRPYWMPVDVLSVDATAKHVAVPKLRPYVYQVVALTNPAPYPLLAGTVHSYRRGRYMGDAQLAYKAPGEAMEVSLGPDEEIRIDRRDLRRMDRGAGLFSSTKAIERAYRNSLTNNSGEDVTVELRENIPVSKNEEITVTLDKTQTTGPLVIDAERGLLNWTVSLQPRQKKDLDLHYKIALPEDWSVAIR